MSHPQPPQRQPTHAEIEKYAQAVHTVALVAVVACPIIALLPPRKLDFYTLGLAGTAVYSGNYLLRESTGRSVWQHLGGGPQSRTPAQAVQGRESVVGEMQKQARGVSSGTESTHAQREAWKIQREKEIRQDVDEGKGFGDMIMDQIWEVWNWGKTKDEDED